MAGEVGRCGGPGRRGEIGRRAHHREAVREADADRRHVARDRVAEAEAGVEAISHDVDHAVLRDDLQAHAGVARQEDAPQARADDARRRDGDVEAQRPARLAAAVAHRRNGFGDAPQGRPGE